MNRRTAGRLGKMPTTSVRRRISLLRRSCGLFDQTLHQWASRKEGKARISGPTSASSSAAGPEPLTRFPRWDTPARSGNARSGVVYISQAAHPWLPNLRWIRRPRCDSCPPLAARQRPVPSVTPRNRGARVEAGPLRQVEETV